MRTVFTNSMCAHVWAQESQEYGRSDHMYFNGATLFSYSTPIARIVRDKNGNKVALFTCRRYSMTTSSKHMPAAHSAWSGDSYSVPSLDPDHAANLAYLIKQYETTKLRLRRMLSDPYSPIYDCLAHDVANAEGYADAFGLECSLDRAGDAAAIEAFRAERKARLNTPAYAAKRERERVRREEREQEKQRIARMEAIERIAQWRAGNTSVRLNWNEMRDANGSAMLRLRGDIVETSQGATVPVEHANRAFRVVKRCHDTATGWESNGHSLHVGQFTVSRIAPNGDLWAGCHFITWAEIEAFAHVAGWAE